MLRGRALNTISISPRHRSHQVRKIPKASRLPYRSPQKQGAFMSPLPLHPSRPVASQPRGFPVASGASFTSISFKAMAVVSSIRGTAPPPPHPTTPHPPPPRPAKKRDLGKARVSENGRHNMKSHKMVSHQIESWAHLKMAGMRARIIKALHCSRKIW